MDARLAAKKARHAREGITYPNRGALLSLPPELMRLREKQARHAASGSVQGSEPTAPAVEPEAEPKAAEGGKSKGSGGR